MSDKLYRVLIVDDEPFMLEGLRLMIDWRACGFELVGEADTGLRALELFKTLKPDIVISDIRMPGMTGTELAREISENDPRALTILFSGYRDFKYAQSAIRENVFGYLLKPIDATEVHKLLADAKTALSERDKALVSALSGSDDHLLRRLVYGDDSSGTLRQCALILGIRSTDELKCLSIEAPLENVMPVLPRNARAFELSPSLTCVTLICDVTIEYISNIIKSISPTPRAGLGSKGTGANGFRESARQSLLALGARFETVSGICVYRASDVSLASWLSLCKCDAISNAVNMKRQDELTELLASVRREYAARRPVAFCLRVMAQNVMLSLRNGEALAELCKSDMPDSLKWLDDFCAALNKTLKIERPDDTPEIVKQALIFIDNNYSDELSLSDLAAKLFINAAYLGQLIKRHTGDTFNQLLSARRMTEACRLLRQTRMPVREVADSVGISDESYFAIRFKKHTGMTPLSYRSDTRLEDGK